MSVLPREQEIEYPSSDGQPMAERQEHAQAIIELLLGLRQRYAGAPDGAALEAELSRLRKG